MNGSDIRASFDEADVFETNSVTGKTHMGGPKCILCSKEVPMLVIPTPKVIITSKILAEMLKRLENLDVSPRKKDGNLAMTFILIDDNNSIPQIPFLRYVNDERHIWKACTCMSNGTGNWQVGDSAQNNGYYKKVMSKYKDILFT